MSHVMWRRIWHVTHMWRHIWSTYVWHSITYVDNITSCVTHVDEWRHTSERLMSHRCEWVAAHVSMSHGARSYVTRSHMCQTISRLLKIIGLFCRIWSLLQGSFAKETYHSNIWYFTCDMCKTCDMWRLRWVGPLKLQVSVAEYGLFDRALLQKRPIILTWHIFGT